jgi:uncharacterized protein DUF4259
MTSPWLAGCLGTEEARTWVDDLTRRGEPAIRDALEAASAAGRDDRAECCGLAAAEIVASACGEPPDGLPDPARAWVDAHGVPSDELVDLALQVVREISHSSRADDPDRSRAVRDLRFRLGDVAAA